HGPHGGVYYIPSEKPTSIPQAETPVLGPPEPEETELSYSQQMFVDKWLERGYAWDPVEGKFFNGVDAFRVKDDQDLITQYVKTRPPLTCVIGGQVVPIKRTWEYYPFPSGWKEAFEEYLYDLTVDFGMQNYGMDKDQDPRPYDHQSMTTKLFLWMTTVFKEELFYHDLGSDNESLPYTWVLEAIKDNTDELMTGYLPNDAWETFTKVWFKKAESLLTQKNLDERKDLAPWPNLYEGDKTRPDWIDPRERIALLRDALDILRAKYSPPGEGGFNETPDHLASITKENLMKNLGISEEALKTSPSTGWNGDWSILAALIRSEASGALIRRAEDYIKRYDDGDSDHSWAHPHFVKAVKMDEYGVIQYPLVKVDKLVEKDDVRDWVSQVKINDAPYSQISDFPLGPKRAIDDYCRQGFNYIKAVLRQSGRYWDGDRKIQPGTATEAQRFVELIDEAIVENEIETEIPILHGVGSLKSMGIEDDSTLGPGSVLVDRSYTSWSLDPWTSYDFTSRGSYAHGKVPHESPGNPNGYPVVLCIVNPKGISAIYAGGSEYEYILPHGMRFVVKKIEDVKVSPNARWNPYVSHNAFKNDTWHVITVEPEDPKPIPTYPWEDHRVDPRGEQIDREVVEPSVPSHVQKIHNLGKYESYERFIDKLVEMKYSWIGIKDQDAAADSLISRLEDIGLDKVEIISVLDDFNKRWDTVVGTSPWHMLKYDPDKFLPKNLKLIPPWIKKAGPGPTKIYLKPGQKVAPGTKLYHGPRGGVYYIPGEITVSKFEENRKKSGLKWPLQTTLEGHETDLHSRPPIPLEADDKGFVDLDGLKIPKEDYDHVLDRVRSERREQGLKPLETLTPRQQRSYWENVGKHLAKMGRDAKRGKNSPLIQYLELDPKVDQKITARGYGWVNDYYHRTFEHLACFDKEGNEIWMEEGDQSSVSPTMEHISQAKGCILTHNHPSGRSLSRIDISFVVHCQGREIRAIGDRAEFIARVNPVICARLKNVDIANEMNIIERDFINRTSYLLEDSGGPYKIENMNHWASRCFNFIMAEKYGYEYIERPLPGGPPIDKIPEEFIQVRDEIMQS
ncbi:MAG: hypothetical protein WC489_08630, partial [Patescibacteria group bacterium]